MKRLELEQNESDRVKAGIVSNKKKKMKDGVFRVLPKTSEIRRMARVE